MRGNGHLIRQGCEDCNEPFIKLKRMRHRVRCPKCQKAYRNRCQKAFRDANPGYNAEACRMWREANYDTYRQSQNNWVKKQRAAITAARIMRDYSP